MCISDKTHTPISDIYCNSDQEQLHIINENCYRHIWAQHGLYLPGASQAAEMTHYILLMATVCCSFQWRDMGLSILTPMDKPFMKSNVK
jgi:hypothetical protein